MKKMKFVEESHTGLRMEEGAARKLDEVMKTASSEAEYKRKAVPVIGEDFTLDAGTRSDISMITTDSIDRDGEVVVPGGIDTRNYNGVVTFAHTYDALPVGRCLWIKPKDNGLLAKTMYAPKPTAWGDEQWFPDAVLSLMQMDPPTCTGKSIGFIRMEAHGPTPDEIRARPELANCWLITDKAVLIEYAVAPVPCNPDAEMIAISKGIKDASLRDMILDAARKVAGSATPAQLVNPKVSPLASSIVEPAKAMVTFVHPKSLAEAVAAKILGRKDELATLVQHEIRESFYDLIGRP